MRNVAYNSLFVLFLLDNSIRKFTYLSFYPHVGSGILAIISLSKEVDLPLGVVLLALRLFHHHVDKLQM